MDAVNRKPATIWISVGVVLVLLAVFLFKIAGKSAGRDIMVQDSLAMSGLIAYVAATISLIIGCIYFCKAKGYPGVLGLLGLLGIFGLIILLFLKDKNK
jgi:hypothetical protein